MTKNKNISLILVFLFLFACNNDIDHEHEHDHGNTSYDAYKVTEENDDLHITKNEKIIEDESIKAYAQKMIDLGQEIPFILEIDFSREVHNYSKFIASDTVKHTTGGVVCTVRRNFYGCTISGCADVGVTRAHSYILCPYFN